VVADQATVVEDVLELPGGWRALPRAQVGQAADIRRIQGRSGRRRVRELETPRILET
jgi:hypothetical protein